MKTETVKKKKPAPSKKGKVFNWDKKKCTS